MTATRLTAVRTDDEPQMPNDHVLSGVLTESRRLRRKIAQLMTHGAIGYVLVSVLFALGQAEMNFRQPADQRISLDPHVDAPTSAAVIGLMIAVATALNLTTSSMVDRVDRSSDTGRRCTLIARVLLLTNCAAVAALISSALAVGAYFEGGPARVDAGRTMPLLAATVFVAAIAADTWATRNEISVTDSDLRHQEQVEARRRLNQLIRTWLATHSGRVTARRVIAATRQHVPRVVSTRRTRRAVRRRASRNHTSATRRGSGVGDSDPGRGRGVGIDHCVDDRVQSAR